MQVLRFWEVLWSGHLSRQFHVYCAAAVLERHRRTIMERDLDFDGLLKCANLLERALWLFHTVLYTPLAASHAGVLHIWIFLQTIELRQCLCALLTREQCPPV